MKILLVNDYATPTGGAELLIAALRDGLRRRGHDARLFASSARPGAAASLADYACLGTTSHLRTLLQTANPSAFWQLRRVLADFQPDVVHVGMFLTQLSPLILPLLKNVPTLYHAVWYRAICPLGTKFLPAGAVCHMPAGAACYRHGCLPLRDWLPLMIQMKLWWRWRQSFDLTVVMTGAMQRRLMAEGLAPAEIIRPGVATAPARPPLAGPPLVAFAGRLVREKGADVLVRAFARVAAEVPEARLILAGDGPEQPRLSELIDRLELSPRVSLTGHLSRAEVERRFAGAWVQVVPSRWEEPFGLVAAEAMMRGTAVVASARGGLPEIVRDGETGLLVPPDDTDALASALLRLVRSRELSEQMGCVGRRVALEHFSDATAVERFVRLYERLSQQKVNAHGP